MIIDGKAIAAQIEKEIKEKVAKIHGRKPCLGVILVGNHAPSQIYVNRKTKACEAAGIRSFTKNLSEATTEQELINVIDVLNSDDAVDGILLQLPLPKQINANAALQRIAPEKDVDGLHPYNFGKLLMGEKDGFVPCTPLGIRELLIRSNIETTGRKVLVLGRSNLVGKPIAVLLMQNAIGGNATVTVAHSKSQNIKELCFNADIIIAAMGQPKFITQDMVKKGSIIIDVGINKIGNTIVGDVDFDALKEKCAFITPVPGGVGPMTIAMLLSNTLKSYFQRIS